MSVSTPATATSALAPEAVYLGDAAAAATISGLAAGGASLGAGIGAGIAALGPAAAALRRQRKKDVAQMEAGKLGWSEAQKRQYLGEAMRASRAQLAPAEAEAARERAIAGVGRAGVLTEEAGVRQREAQTGVAGAVGVGEGLSQQQVLIREPQIKAELAAHVAKVARDWGNVMGGLAGTAGTIAGGSPEAMGQLAGLFGGKG